MVATGVTTSAGVNIKLSTILQFTNSTTTLYLVSQSTNNSVVLTGSTTLRTRIA